ncbi:restriction endonuclease subunit S [Aureibaculum sp. A20]|uniref:Restriction endonuclease subunit S n=1 Tax=Aureibaculum flavum TaxID=2795986 RepID=A0ABS0WRY3_9FLAO|nr:restriction endonuclease subunit S [Aureibaculum flavum]MBJ2174716.1 restriction endonuclease subunit S [Aureibaculum flavum]
MAYVQLGGICNVVKGEIGITKAIPGDYPMVTTAEFRKSHNKFQLDTEAVLIPLVSATGHGHASIKRVHYQEGKFAFGSILAACVPKDENYSAKFLYIYFNLMKDYVLVPLMKGSANVSLTLGNLKKAKVPNISLQTQLDIVELYSKIRIEQDKATDVLAKQETDINYLRQAILQEAVQGKLTADWRANNPYTEDASQLLKRIQEEKAQLIKDKKIKKEKALPPITKDEIPYELPEGWVWCRLGNTLLYSDSGKSPNCVKRPVINQEWGVLTTTAVQQNRFVENANKVLPVNYEINPKQIVEIGDILITRAGPINRTGISCKVDKLNFNLILSDKTIRLKYIKDSLFPDFVVLTLNSESIRNLLLDKMIGMASSQVNISQTNIKGICFPFPPLEEQKAIVEKVNALMGLCDVLEQEVQQSQAHSEQLMQSVLREVFEGEKTI